MSVEEPIKCRTTLSEEERLQLQSSIIQAQGRYYTCDKCKTRFHLLDLAEEGSRIDQLLYLRYICEKCNLCLVEAKIDG